MSLSCLYLQGFFLCHVCALKLFSVFISLQHSFLTAWTKSWRPFVYLPLVSFSCISILRFYWVFSQQTRQTCTEMCTCKRHRKMKYIKHSARPLRGYMRELIHLQTCQRWAARNLCRHTWLRVTWAWPFCCIKLSAYLWFRYLQM